MNRDQVLTAAIRLHDAAQHGHTAFWVFSHSRGSFEYHARETLDALTKAALELGYTLTPLKEAQHVADTQDQPDGGRLNLRQESPAPFSENYGA